jgi:hypothetical protein
MGALAFAFLMAAEVALGLWAFGRTAGEIAAGMATREGRLGLAGQIVFALLPLAALRAGR